MTRTTAYAIALVLAALCVACLVIGSYQRIIG